jgi:antitoxin component YwqK of YwqJK toxin-antitoxin module
MTRKILTITCLLAISILANCQNDPELNRTDQTGKKQGHWIKKYPNTNIMYDGFFKDNHPVGEFRRYNQDNTLKSLLVYSEDGKEAIASIYHPNGYIASKGKYINQLREGIWQFFSITTDGYIISEENYTKNLKNGVSYTYYPDKKVAEKLNYINNIKHGEWIQYYPDGSVLLKTSFLNGKMNGKFEVWFENGKLEFSGKYKNDARDGQWLIYNKDGSIKYKIDYLAGVTKDRQMEIDESDFLDSLERNKGKIPDPEKTGVLR